MKVFVTGASGFIGAHVTRMLLSRGHSVRVLALPEDPLWRLQAIMDQFSIVTGMLNDEKALRRELTEFPPDTCIHLAWYAEPGKYLHSHENISSLTASLSLLTELIKVGCQHVVMAGTCAEYDTDFGYLHEDTPTRPATLYAAAKLACFQMSRQIVDRSKIRFAWGRIFYPYGPQEDERRVVPAVINALLQGQYFPATTGEQVRDYIHVEDVATALCLLAENQADGAFNISSGMPVTVRQLLETIGNLIGRKELIEFGAQPYRSWEPPFICGDNRIIKEMGWKPTYTLDNGLGETIQWWEEEVRACSE